MNRSLRLTEISFGCITLLGIFAIQISAQPVQQAAGGFDFASWMFMGTLVIASACPIGAVFWNRNKQPQNSISIMDHSPENSPTSVQSADGDGKVSTQENLSPAYQHSIPEKIVDVGPLAGLPVSTFLELKPSSNFDALPVSDDMGLLAAIEEIHGDLEPDAEIREISLRVLAAFRANNSVAALSQITLHDPSAALRLKALSALIEFNHESVFKTIVLACADPAAEVRVAAARGLYRQNFNRADAWTRIAESNDESTLRKAAKAAMEVGLIERSLERLVHPDANVAYEAFTLAALLIKAGEAKTLLTALTDHDDENVKLAILHVIKVLGESATVDVLNDLIDKKVLAPQILEKVEKAARSLVGRLLDPRAS